MSMVIRKKQLLAAALALALGSAVFVNWYYNRVEKTSADTQTSVEEEYAGENLGDSLLVQGSTENQEKDDEEAEDKSEDGEKGKTDKSVSDSVATAEFFAGAQLDRDRAHDETEKLVREVCENENASDEMKKKAESCLEQLTDELKKESDTQALISAKLDCDCLVVLNNGKAQVVVPTGILDSTAALRISEIIKEQTGINGENISIIEAK